MVVAAHRAYSDAKRWMRSARPRRLDKWAFARRAFGRAFVAGIVVLGLISLVSPSQFGEPGSDTLQTGWPLWVVLGLIALGLVFALRRAGNIRWVIRRIQEPLSRPLDEHPSYEGAVSALSSCPSVYQTRFGLIYVWLPAARVVLATLFAFASAYFVIDAVLSSFLIGWQQPVYAIVFALLSVIVFALTAPRLATWRLAMSVQKAISTGYV